MFKFVTAGVTAIALTLSSVPAQARGLSEDDVGKLLFGLIAAGVLSQVIDNKPRSTVQVAPQQNHSARQSERRIDATRVLPRTCLTGVETGRGTQRMFGRSCLQRNDVNLRNLPNDCAVRVRSNGNTRRGFNSQCLRDAGFRTQRR